MRVRLIAGYALLVVAVLIGARAHASASPDRLHLSIGDPERKLRDVPVVLDAITDARTADRLSPDDLAARLDGVGMLIVGERHTDVHAHRVEARVVDALARRGRRVIVGLEMYPYTEQRWLDAWNANLVTESGFLQLSGWYRNWGFPWQYYRDVFLTAREAEATMVALNAPADVVAAVRTKGLDHLTPEEAARLPPGIEAENGEALQLFQASVPHDDSIHDGGMPADAWKRLLAVQATWEATMAYNAAKVLNRFDDGKTIMVVLAGAAHVEYGVGIERQARRWYDKRIATLIPVPVESFAAEPQTVRASYADFLWGIPVAEYPEYPELGVVKAAGARVLDVQPHSAASGAGVKPGDLLVSIDGAPADQAEAYNTVMAGKRWGDAATLVVRRGDETLTLRAVFRRSPPDPPRAAGPVQ